MSGLQDLRKPEVREALWRAELAGWLHNIGKITNAFVRYQRKQPLEWNSFRLEYVTGSLLAANITRANNCVAPNSGILQFSKDAF